MKKDQKHLKRVIAGTCCLLCFGVAFSAPLFADDASREVEKTVSHTAAKSVHGEQASEEERDTSVRKGDEGFMDGNPLKRASGV